jgi:Protein of unknown function (DUF669)
MATRRAKSGDAVVVDFSDTESRGGRKGGRSAHLPEGDYTAKVKAAEFGHSSEKETPGIMMTWVITGPNSSKGKTIRDSLWLSDKALWRVRQTLEALGLQVPSKKVKVNPKSMIGKEAAITLEDEEWEGKVRSRIVDCFALAEYEELAESSDEELDEDEEDEEEDEAEDDTEDEEEEVEVDLDDLDSI